MTDKEYLEALGARNAKMLKGTVILLAGNIRLNKGMAFLLSALAKLPARRRQSAPVLKLISQTYAKYLLKLHAGSYHLVIYQYFYSRVVY